LPRVTVVPHRFASPLAGFPPAPPAGLLQQAIWAPKMFALTCYLALEGIVSERIDATYKSRRGNTPEDTQPHIFQQHALRMVHFDFLTRGINVQFSWRRVAET